MLKIAQVVRVQNARRRFLGSVLRAALPCVLVAATALALPVQVKAFEIADLPMQEKRQTFFKYGSYALGVNSVITDPEPNRFSKKPVEIAFYYVSEKQWDRICTVNFKQPVEVIKTETSTTLKSETFTIEISAEGISYRNAQEVQEAGKGVRICHVYLDAVRFDDALAYGNDKKGKLSQRQILPYKIVNSKEAFDQKAIAERMQGDDDFKPTWAMATVEGLWVEWEASLKAEKLERMLDDVVGLRSTGGSGAPSFYNTAKTTEAGASFDFTIRMRVEPMEGFPKPTPVTDEITLHDSHIHITSNTDIRDSALMARKYGYRMEVLAILYKEDTHGRLFLGDPHAFDVAKRYPDVFIPFALVQFNTHGFAGVPRKGPDTPEHMIQQWRDGALGYKALVKWSKGELVIDDPAYDTLYDVAEERRMPFVHHTEGEGDGSSPTHAAGVAAKHPNLPVIMAHLQVADIEVVVKVLKKHPNLYIQHSHLIQKQPDGTIARDRLVQEGLAHKIVFGTDLQTDHSPMVNDRRVLQKQLEEAGVDQKTIDGILFGTIENMLQNVVRPEAAAD